MNHWQGLITLGFLLGQLNVAHGDFLSEICDRVLSAGAGSVEETAAGGQDRFADMYTVRAI